MEIFFDFVMDLFLELFVWEQLNSFLIRAISNRFLRWTVATLIYLLVLIALLLVLIGICRLIKIVI